MALSAPGLHVFITQGIFISALVCAELTDGVDETTHRSEDGRWICRDLDATDADNPDEAQAMAKALLSYLIWWGDVNAIFLTKHYRSFTSFIPPEGCD